MVCNPPAANYERNGAEQNAKFGMQGVLDFDQSDLSGDEEYMISHDPNGLPWDMQGNMQMPMHPGQYHPGVDGAFPNQQFPSPEQQQDFSLHDLGLPVDNTSFDDGQHHNILTKQQSVPRSESTSWSQTDYASPDLSDMLGELKISANGVGKLLAKSLFILTLN